MSSASISQILEPSRQVLFFQYGRFIFISLKMEIKKTNSEKIPPHYVTILKNSCTTLDRIGICEAFKQN